VWNQRFRFDVSADHELAWLTADARANPVMGLRLRNGRPRQTEHQQE